MQVTAIDFIRKASATHLDFLSRAGKVAFLVIPSYRYLRFAISYIIKNPAVYLEKVRIESVIITKGGRAIAVLEKPNDTPVSDSLLGLLKDSGIKSTDDIKDMRLNV